MRGTRAQWSCFPTCDRGADPGHPSLRRIGLAVRLECHSSTFLVTVMARKAASVPPKQCCWPVLQGFNGISIGEAAFGELHTTCYLAFVGFVGLSPDGSDLAPPRLPERSGSHERVWGLLEKLNGVRGQRLLSDEHFFQVDGTVRPVASMSLEGSRAETPHRIRSGEGFGHPSPAEGARGISEHQLSTRPSLRVDPRRLLPSPPTQPSYGGIVLMDNAMALIGGLSARKPGTGEREIAQGDGAEIRCHQKPLVTDKE